MIQVLGYIFAVGGISALCCLMTGITIISLMAANVIEFNPPPKWLWLWLMASIWVVFAGGIPYAFLSR